MRNKEKNQRKYKKDEQIDKGERKR